MERLSFSLCLQLVAAGASLLSCQLSNFEVEDGAGTGGAGLGGSGASAGSGTGAVGTGASSTGGSGTGAGGTGTGAMGSGGASGGAGGSGGTGGVIPPYACAGADEARMPGGSCFAILEKVPFDQARTDCQAWGGDLAIVNSQAIHDFIIASFDPDAWIGLRDQAPPTQAFKWVDGSALAAFPMLGQEPPWSSNEPSNDEDCIKLKGGTYESKDCDTHSPGGGILCEQP